ncbi:hypothetical protein [Leifsonia sp. 2MCAF36]|uniref:hypothetical protein n=1 Tax=Leifsonia sp. 2MCAF36 TaxID=3232988 RepID=UPI003F9C4608
MTTEGIIYGVVALSVVAVIVAGILTITSIRLNTVRRGALNPPTTALTMTGLYGSVTNAVLRRMATASGTESHRTGQRFTVIVDESAMTWWRGSAQPTKIATFPLSTISDVKGGTTHYGRITYQTLFLGVTVLDKTYELQLRLTGPKGITYASVAQREDYVADLWSRVAATNPGEDV